MSKKNQLIVLIMFLSMINLIYYSYINQINNKKYKQKKYYSEKIEAINKVDKLIYEVKDEKEKEDNTIICYRFFKNQALINSLEFNDNEGIFTKCTYKIGPLKHHINYTYFYNGYEKSIKENYLGKEYSIYNPEKHITYLYNSNTSDGLKFSNQTEQDTFIYRINDVKYLLNKGKLKKAIVTKWNNFDTIYIETKINVKSQIIHDEAINKEKKNEENISNKEENQEDFVDEYTVKSWISIKYGYPVKNIVYNNNTLLYSGEVLEIKNVENMNNTFFKLPSNIYFQEYETIIKIDNSYNTDYINGTP